MLWLILSAQNQQTNQSKAVIHGKTSRIFINNADDQFQFFFLIKLSSELTNYVVADPQRPKPTN